MEDSHKKFLIKAHLLATKQFGKTFPNPSVGCLIVKKGKIISKAVTASEGRPHAEELALHKAGDKSIGSTMYVTLEPCFHNSTNGSCADQIVKAGIKKIYIANIDPDLRTKGKSIKKFNKNNLYTVVGKTSSYTKNLNKFFFESLKTKRPFIKVKMAISKDEKIARSDYTSKWISNNESRNYGHLLRFQSQAILTTSKTLIKDNPRFTVRTKNKIIKYMSVIVIDKNLNIPINSKIIQNMKDRKIIIITSIDSSKSLKLEKLGCQIIKMKLNDKNQFNLKNVMKKIFLLNFNNLLVEAGGIFLTNLLKSNLVDEMHIFTSPLNIGNSGKSFIINKKIKDLNLKENCKKFFGKDVYQLFSFIK